MVVHAINSSTPALRRLRNVHLYKFEASQSYTEKPCWRGVFIYLVKCGDIHL